MLPSRIDACLVAGGKYHDVDFARLQILALLGEHPRIRTRVREDYRDVAGLLDKPIDEVKRMLGLNERVASVDVPRTPDTDKSLIDSIPDEQNTDPSVLLQDRDVQVHIDLWLSKLNDKQRAVVERRFGLHGHESATLEEVGNELGVTRERVRQIQIEALRRLREILEREGFSIETVFEG
jgi:RNA polymerase nonessential primary-like sigma factor